MSKNSSTRFVFITGGVLSGIGKGVTTASIAKLLQFRGYSIRIIKIDPYLNIDPGTLNPIEHGEVFVTDDIWTFSPVKGFDFKISEIDLDFGTYERFTGMEVHPSQNITSGQIYMSVILEERKGGFLGRTVQIIPHITDRIKQRVWDVINKDPIPDVLLVEIGGTVGDIEAMPFLEAVRQLVQEVGRNRVAVVHVTLVPYMKSVGEFKTKPTQHSARTLQSLGIQPDIMICRSEMPLSHPAKEKIALFCNVPEEQVISNPDIPQPCPFHHANAEPDRSWCRWPLHGSASPRLAAYHRLAGDTRGFLKPVNTLGDRHAKTSQTVEISKRRRSSGAGGEA
ncbi:MAG: CTP synthase [Actinobacteria bacterium]|nr:CTP synthase [Actinomycetota bacterium]